MGRGAIFTRAAGRPHTPGNAKQINEGRYRKWCVKKRGIGVCKEKGVRKGGMKESGEEDEELGS
jgi:hypothetical protein